MADGSLGKLLWLAEALEAEAIGYGGSSRSVEPKAREALKRARDALDAGLRLELQTEVTEAMKQAGVRELFLTDMQPIEDAWEEKIARVYLAMRAASA